MAHFEKRGKAELPSLMLLQVRTRVFAYKSNIQIQGTIHELSRFRYEINDKYGTCFAIFTHQQIAGITVLVEDDKIHEIKIFLK